MALSTLGPNLGGQGSGGKAGNMGATDSPNPHPNGFLAKTTLVNHAAPSLGKQSFSRDSKIKATPGKLGQSSNLSQRVSSLRRKGAIS